MFFILANLSKCVGLLSKMCCLAHICMTVISRACGVGDFPLVLSSHLNFFYFLKKKENVKDISVKHNKSLSYLRRKKLTFTCCLTPLHQASRIQSKGQIKILLSVFSSKCISISTTLFFTITHLPQ